MDQLAREDIAAAAAVHQELGRDYDRAVAEGLIERIGAEIDKRVDARLSESGARPRGRPGRSPAPPPDSGQLVPASRSAWPGVILALGSMGIGAGISAGTIAASSTIGPNAITHQVGPAQVGILLIVWIVIAVINVAYARRR
jgi:hypothetical protein